MAVIDTGINPYHATFRDTSRRAYQHPSTYLSGFPRSAGALRLTLSGGGDYWHRLRKDCARVWSKVVPGRLYWIPGTRIVGAITFSPDVANCHVEKPSTVPIVDGDGHGTMTASRVASSAYGACKRCLLVAVEFPTEVYLLDPEPSTRVAVDAIRWAASQSAWIDAQSNSWGPVSPLFDPSGRLGLVAASSELIRASEEVSRKHLAFWASGNGAALQTGLVGQPTLVAPHHGPSGVIVGGHDSGYVATWPGFTPHVVSDACASWAAEHQSLTASSATLGSGTSAATPFVAGGAAEILREARRLLGDTRTGVRGGAVAIGTAGRVRTGPLVDGKLTLQEWRDVTLKTASSRPKAQTEDGPPCPVTDAPFQPSPVRWSDVPAAFPEFTLIGYGAVDPPSVALARRVLSGATALPGRATADEYFKVDRSVRETTYGLWSKA